jgi:hypothetical protein
MLAAAEQTALIRINPRQRYSDAALAAKHHQKRFKADCSK